MKTLFLFASVMLVLFLAAPNKIEAQTPNIVSRLEARVAELEKRLAVVEARLTKIAGTTSGAARAQRVTLSRTSRDDGARFMGNWGGGGYYGYSLSISRDGGKYIVRYVRAGQGGVHVCELSNGSLKCGESVIGFIESSGHITWEGEELQKLP